MVCGYTGDATVVQGLTQHKLVDGGFYGGIHLDFSTQPFMVEHREEEVPHGNFCRNAGGRRRFTLQKEALAVKQLQFLGSGDMGNMQAGAILLCQSHSLGRGCQTSLLAANHGMQRHLRVVAPGFLSLRHVAVDDVRIFAMHHQRQLTGLEDALQRLLSVYQHVPCRRPHKKLDTRNTRRI